MKITAKLESNTVIIESKTILQSSTAKFYPPN